MLLVGRGFATPVSRRCAPPVGRGLRPIRLLVNGASHLGCWLTALRALVVGSHGRSNGKLSMVWETGEAVVGCWFARAERDQTLLTGCEAPGKQQPPRLVQWLWASRTALSPWEPTTKARSTD